jgi:hypothetical protein
MTLAGFLLARIAEDEAHARVGVILDDGHASRLITDPGTDREWVTTFDDARVLTECEAKRRIVEMSAEATAHEVEGDWEHGYSPETRHRYTDQPYIGDKILRALALPYASHPDYREEWRATEA